MKQNIILLLFCLGGLLQACTKYDAYKKYLASGPIVYPGKADSLQARTGRYRVMLSWLLISDPNITGAKVYWNDRQDSLDIPIKRRSGVDTINVIVDKLLEQTYSFDVITYDKEGNQSIPATVSGRVLGTNYEATLTNWKVANSLVSPAISPYSSASVEWNSFYLDGLLGTRVSYTDADGLDRTVLVPSDPTGQSSSITDTLDRFVPGSSFSYSTMYLPDATAIDTFYAAPGKDTPMVANAYAGSYHAVGTRYNFNADGSAAGQAAVDDTRVLTTLSSDKCSINTIANLGSYNGTLFYVQVNPDNTLTFSGLLQNDPSSPIMNEPGTTSTYDPATHTFNVHYMYVNTNGSYRFMDEVWSPN
ncbi:MAG: DUF4361 domain-containing protein [Bacteroidetes bacterium]|nr:DUF4361 domain-containing protein [Bacteroidota bacterium]